MTLRELTTALLDLSTYGIHANDEVLVEGADGEMYEVLTAERDSYGDRDTITLKIGEQR